MFGVFDAVSRYNVVPLHLINDRAMSVDSFKYNWKLCAYVFTISASHTAKDINLFVGRR